MAATIGTILMIGASGGLGKVAAIRLHALGKQVIVTGRRLEELRKIQQSHPSMSIYAFDMTDLAALPGHLDELFRQYPDIDSVWINGGINDSVQFKDPSTSSDEFINRLVTTNLTAPITIARHVVPRLLATSTNANKETNLLVTSSGIAFQPFFQSSIYSATKAGIHHFLVGLRTQLKETPLNVLEICPPLVATDFVSPDAPYHGAVMSRAMTLQDWADELFTQLQSSSASELKEVAQGSAAPRAKMWRDSVGRALEAVNMSD